MKNIFEKAYFGCLVPGVTVEGNIPDMRRLPLIEISDLNKETSEFKC